MVYREHFTFPLIKCDIDNRPLQFVVEFEDVEQFKKLRREFIDAFEEHLVITTPDHGATGKPYNKISQYLSSLLHMQETNHHNRPENIHISIDNKHYYFNYPEDNAGFLNDVMTKIPVERARTRSFSRKSTGPITMTNSDREQVCEILAMIF